MLCENAKRDKEEIEQLKKKISLLEDEIAELDMKNRKLQSAMNHNVRFDDIA
jgi:prefoldin subunit 5